MPVAKTRHRQALVVLSDDGALLFEIGLDQWLPPSRWEGERSLGLEDLLRSHGDEDLGTALSLLSSADDGRSRSVSLSVRPSVGRIDAELRLTLYRFDQSRVIGVLGERNTEMHGKGRWASIPLVDAWSTLRDAMVLASANVGDPGPVILEVNEAFRNLFGVSRERAEGRDLVPFLDPEDKGAFYDGLRAMVEEGGDPLTALTVLEPTSGDPRLVEWELAPIRDTRGRVSGLIGVLGEARASTITRTIHDGTESAPLAEPASRAHLLRRIDRSLEHVRRSSSYGFAVVGLDVEDDNDIRRRFGEAVGEAVLDAFAWRVQRCLRPEDLVARIGARRLAVLLDGFAPTAGVRAVIERMQDAIDSPFHLAGESVWLPTVSTVGFAYGGEHAPESAQQVLEGLGQLDATATDSR